MKRGEGFLTAKCPTCGRDIIWAVNPTTGKRVPIDPRPVIYLLADTVTGLECNPLTAAPGTCLGVSHFATCTKPKHLNKGETTDDITHVC